MLNKTKVFVHRFMLDYDIGKSTYSTVFDVITPAGELPALPNDAWELFSETDRGELSQANPKRGLEGLVAMLTNPKDGRMHTAEFYRNLMTKSWVGLRAEFAQQANRFIVDPTHPRPEVRTMLGASVEFGALKLTVSSITIESSAVARSFDYDKAMDNIAASLVGDQNEQQWLRNAVAKINEELKQWNPMRFRGHQLLVVPSADPTNQHFDILRPTDSDPYMGPTHGPWYLGTQRSFVIELQPTATPVWLPIPVNPTIVFGGDSISMERFLKIGIVE